jgi:CheY-like chemotaxis protein
MNKINTKDHLILIVDDNVNNLTFLFDLLEAFDYNTTFAKNGQEAIEMVEKTKPDLVLLDLMMPVMDGLECCKVLKSNPNYSDIPIVFITASREEKDLTKAFELGANDYVTKPFNRNELLTRIKHQLTIYQQEKQIKDQNLALELSNQKLEKFNHMVCHDIRNPLASIKGYVYLLEKTLIEKLSSREQTFLQYINDGVDKINEIIEGLMILSELKNTDQILFQEVNISNLVETIFAELQKENPQRQSEFIIQPNVIVKANERFLKIALQNLLNNAWKYSSEKEKTFIKFGTVTKENLLKNKVDIPADILHNLAHNDIICFIEDHGAGFEQKYANQIFEIFHRLHTDNDNFQGTGIGLAIVASIINVLNGIIWANGKVNEGATFYFSFFCPPNPQSPPNPPSLGGIPTQSPP